MAIDPVGLAEISDRLGVQRDTVDRWRQRGVLPPARWTVGGRPAWAWVDIEQWAIDTGRLSTTPQAEAVWLVRTLAPVEEGDHLAHFPADSYYGVDGPVPDRHIQRWDQANYLHGYEPRGPRTPEGEQRRAAALAAAEQLGYVTTGGDSTITITDAGYGAAGIRLLIGRENPWVVWVLDGPTTE